MLRSRLDENRLFTDQQACACQLSFERLHQLLT